MDTKQRQTQIFDENIYKIKNLQNNLMKLKKFNKLIVALIILIAKIL